MSVEQLEVLAPLATPLPEPPADEVLTVDQWLTFMSIMDAIIPSIHRESSKADAVSQLTVSDEKYNTTVVHLEETVTGAPDSKDLAVYLDEKPSDISDFQDLLKRSLAYFAREDARKGLAFILSALNTRAGSLILTGSSTLFHHQPIEVRTSIINSWRQSYLPPLPTLYRSLTSTAKNLWFKTSPTFGKLSGFPKVPIHYTPGPNYEYEFLQFPPGDSPEIIETDVVIVGSGCGGSVCAKNLSEAGCRVLVVDKSYYYPPSQLPMPEKEAGIHLFENGGIETSDDNSISIIAGSTWGGGGTINWSASLQTQEYVRKEWADRGLKFFGTEDFQSCLDRVCSRMGVSAEHIRHNHGNRMLLEGARKLGYHAKAVPQNTGGNEHFCGHCTLGCGSAQKQGPVVSWLPDAARAGATFAEGFKVEHIMFDTIKGQKTAIGVKGLWTSRNHNGGVDGPLLDRTTRHVVIKAKKVIVSCGTLWSPIILLNSGLTNRHIGRNLYLHPANAIAAVFKDDIKPWEGGILTTVCTSFENLDGHGHGAKLETTVMMPSWFLTLLNWDSGLDFKLKVLKFRHMNGFISIGRDRDTGRVYKDPKSGVPRIQYTPSRFDRAHVLEGVLALARMALVTGAEEIHVCISGTEPFIRHRDSSASSNSSEESAEELQARFETWLTGIKSTGNTPPAGFFASAHQMGTNRMAVSASQGVVDPNGKVWGVEGLYVADASVFPSASGVNPMVTNMAISDWISRGVGREMSRERSGGVATVGGARL